MKKLVPAAPTLIDTELGLNSNQNNVISSNSPSQLELWNQTLAASLNANSPSNAIQNTPTFEVPQTQEVLIDQGQIVEPISETKNTILSNIETKKENSNTKKYIYVAVFAVLLTSFVIYKKK